MMIYCSPMKANFKKIMNGNDKIEQWAYEESPGPDVRVGFKPGEKKNATYDKNDTADFIKDRIDGFPTKMGL